MAIVAWTSSVGAATYCVDSIADPGSGVANDCANDCTTKNGGACSLANAILLANQTAGMDTIAFHLGASGVKTIALNSALPTITSPLLLDGYSEPGSDFAFYVGSAAITVVLKNNVSTIASALVIDAGANGSVIRGLSAGGFQTAITINAGVTGVHIIGNIIGISPSGGVLPNTVAGVAVAGNANAVGGAVAAESNVIANATLAGAGVGVRITGNGNSVEGNLIGLALNGDDPAPNDIGVSVSGDSNIIGGTTVSKMNFIAGSIADNVVLAGTNNKVAGNFIGVTVNGDAGSGGMVNGANCVSVTGANAFVGGPTAAEGNWIHGCDQGAVAGVAISGASATVQHNIIGENSDGNTTGIRVSGGGAGPYLIADNTIDRDGTGVAIESTSAVVIDGNVISRNSADGITVTSSDATITRNIIGTTSSGNTGAGIRVQGAGTVHIGHVGQGNLIQRNLTGIVVDSASTALVAISGNGLQANTALGIDIGAAGVTANDDSNESDAAFNFPTLTTTTGNGDALDISGTIVTSVRSGAVRVELFDSPTCDGSGYGQGLEYLGAFDVNTDANGNATFTNSVAANAPDGYAISATATELVATVPTRTSESSLCQTLAKHGTIAWTTTAAEVVEEGGPLILTLTRKDGASGAVSIAVATASGTATADVDFVSLAETVSFADGELSKQVSIAMIDDSVVDSGEIFTVVLTNPLGGASIGGTAAATVTIVDSDVVSSSSGGSGAGAVGGTSAGGSAGAGSSAGSSVGSSVGSSAGSSAGGSAHPGGSGAALATRANKQGCGAASPEPTVVCCIFLCFLCRGLARRTVARVHVSEPLRL